MSNGVYIKFTNILLMFSQQEDIRYLKKMQLMYGNRLIKYSCTISTFEGLEQIERHVFPNPIYFRSLGY